MITVLLLAFVMYFLYESLNVGSRMPQCSFCRTKNGNHSEDCPWHHARR